MAATSRWPIATKPACSARRRDRSAHQRKVTVHRVDVGEPAQIAAFAQAADRRASRPQHRHQQCRRRPDGPVPRDRPGADGLADEHQFLGRGAWHARVPAASGAAGEAHIVNLSSIFGIIAPPGQTAYAAAKFAVRGFSESLRHELQMANSPVRLSVVHPGGVATNIARNSRSGAGVTDNARRAAVDRRFDELAKTTPQPRRGASSAASRRTSRAS